MAAQHPWSSERQSHLLHSCDVRLHGQLWKTNLNTSLFCTVWEQTTAPREATENSLKAVPFVVLVSWSWGFLCYLLDRIHVCFLSAAGSGCVCRVMAFSFIIRLLLLSKCSWKGGGNQKLLSKQRAVAVTAEEQVPNADLILSWAFPPRQPKSGQGKRNEVLETFEVFSIPKNDRNKDRGASSKNIWVLNKLFVPFML